MKIKSLKFRLTIWYFASFFLTTAIISTSFYFTTRQTLYTNTDSLLSAHSENIKEIVQNSESMHTAIDGKVLAQEFGEMPGMIVAIANSNGEIVGGSALVKSNNISTRFFTESIKGDKPRFENSNFGNSPMRFMITPLYQNSTFLGTLVVGHPIEVIKNSLQSLIWELIVIFSFLALLGMVGGYFIAKEALSPIEKISEKMKVISHKNLDDRVDCPKTEDEVGELALTFNVLLDRLQSAFRREHQFIGDVAHELKTPLAIIKSRIEVALSKERTQCNYKKELAENLKEINNLTSIVKDMLDLAWLESENSARETEALDLSKIVQDLVEVAQSLASAKKITIRSIVEPNIIILGKKDKISRAILNVIDNAIKYTDRNGTISLKLKSDDKDAILKISDNGTGISKEELIHIFERFYRGSAHKKIQGTGLGLSIVKSAVSAHHGSVKALSKKNHGTEIIITLPILK